MAIGWKTKRWLSLVLLCVGLPVYIVLAVTLVGYLERPSPLAELAIYAAAGILWALPFKGVFSGIGVSKDKHEGKEEVKK